MRPYEIAMLIEQVLGHVTYTLNLYDSIARDREIHARWAPLTWDGGALPPWLPLSGNWTVRAGLQARRALAAMARDGAPDVLFFHTQVPATLALDWLRRIPSVISLDATPRQYDEIGQRHGHARGAEPLERLKGALHRAVFQAVGHLVTFSAWAKQSLVEDYGLPDEKITVNPPGVVLRDWARPTPRGPHDGPVRVLFVGGAFEAKGGMLLLEALRALRAERIELHLVTSEPPPPEPGLFVYTGLRPNAPELRRLYHDCDVFCLPSASDVSSFVLMEAAAAGLPAISTPIAGIREIVRAGETGLFVPVDDLPALTDALRRLIHRPEERLAMGERAAALARERFDAERNSRRLLEVLKRLAGRRHAAGGEASGEVRV